MILIHEGTRRKSIQGPSLFHGISSNSVVWGGGFRGLGTRLPSMLTIGILHGGSWDLVTGDICLR